MSHCRKHGLYTSNNDDCPYCTIEKLELDAHTKDAFYGERIAELEAQLAEAKNSLDKAYIMLREAWHFDGEEMYDCNLTTDA